MDTVELVARCLCRHDGFSWNLLPTWADTFTDGLSHEEYRSVARDLLNEEFDTVGAPS